MLGTIIFGNTHITASVVVSGRPHLEANPPTLPAPPSPPPPGRRSGDFSGHPDLPRLAGLAVLLDFLTSQVAKRRTTHYSQPRERSGNGQILMLGLGPKRRDSSSLCLWCSNLRGNPFGTTPIPLELLSWQCQPTPRNPKMWGLIFRAL